MVKGKAQSTFSAKKSTRFLVEHQLVHRADRERGLQTTIKQWYTANHLQNVFTKDVLREKIKESRPSIFEDQITDMSANAAGQY